MKREKKKLRKGEKKNLEPTHFFSKLTTPLIFSLIFGPFHSSYISLLNQAQ